MKHRTRLLRLAIVIVIATLHACTSDDVNTECLNVGDRVPTFAVEVIHTDGTTTTFSTQHLTGTTVIVFFNTSCSDCQRDLPRLNSYYLQHQHEDGFQMVAISREEGQTSIDAFWRENDIKIPFSPQHDRAIYNRFATSIIPRIYFCNADGIITRIDVEKFNIEDNTSH